MEINITGRNLNLDNSLKEYVHKRLDKFEQLYKDIHRCEVVLEEKKLRKNIEIILHLKRSRVMAKESSPDIYASIDIASETIKKQLRRLNDKAYSKKRRNVFSRIMKSITSFKDMGKMGLHQKQGEIVKTNFFADKPMLPEEAKLELEVMEKNFIMFKNADTGQPNVIYKRSDGNYGLIEPSF